MRYISSYKIFEKNLDESRYELKQFQDQMELKTNLTKLLDSIEAVQLSTNTIFPFISGGEMIDTLDDDKQFQDELEERELKTSELFDTEDSATLIKIRIKYYWIYPEESGELDIPLYLMLQYYMPKKQKWSEIKLFYVQKEIENFYSELSSVIMILKKKDDASKEWKYKTSNSGLNWDLEDPKTATETFKKVLEIDDVEALANHSQIEITFQ